jgi:lipoprotein signal peptidase
MTQLISTEQTRIRDELIGLIDRTHPPQPAVMIGLFGQNGSGKTTILDSLVRTTSALAIRTRNHRRVVGVNIDCTIIPGYMLPWHYIISQVLDKLDEQALPSEIEVIKSLRNGLGGLIKRNPNMSENDEAAAILAFTKHFKQTFPALVASTVTQANNVLLIGLDHIDKVDPDTCADILDSAIYFLRVPGVAIVVAAEEGVLVEKINIATNANDGAAQLRTILQARLELPARVKAVPSTAKSSIFGTSPPSKPSVNLTIPTIESQKAGENVKSDALTLETVASDVKSQPELVKNASSAEFTPNTSSISSPKTTETVVKKDKKREDFANASQKRTTSATRFPFTTSPLVLALMVFALDRITKTLVRYAAPEPPGISLIPGLMRLEQYFSTTTANGLIRGSLGLGAEIVAFILTIVLLLFSLDRRTSVNRTDITIRIAALGLMFGSLATNLLDRLLFGGVLNFIHVGSLPVFNIAHIMLLVGELLLIYSLLKTSRS